MSRIRDEDDDISIIFLTHLELMGGYWGKKRDIERDFQGKSVHYVIYDG